MHCKIGKLTKMQYILIFKNGKSQSFYNEKVARMYQKINGGFIVNLMMQDSLDFSPIPSTMDTVD